MAEAMRLAVGPQGGWRSLAVRVPRRRHALASFAPRSS